jgi:hypothetical protein
MSNESEQLPAHLRPFTVEIRVWAPCGHVRNMACSKGALKILSDIDLDQ